jgi:glucokinase
VVRKNVEGCVLLSILRDGGAAWLEETRRRYSGVLPRRLLRGFRAQARFARSPSAYDGSVTRRAIAGVDIGGTKTAVTLSIDPPRTVSRAEFPTDPRRGPEHAIASIVGHLRGAVALAREQEAGVAAIGISCGGPLESARGIIQRPPNLSTWDDVPIVDLLATEFGVPCFLQNDANAGALAEFRYGAGRGARNMVFLTMGTGLGAGLIVNGELLCGVTDAAGEIGHLRLTRSGPVGYGKAGSVEGWASGGGMAQVARTFAQATLRSGNSTLLCPQGMLPEVISARDVAAAASQGDRVAKRVVRKVGDKLGETLAILVDVLNPERIVIGGLALRFGEAVLAPARRRMLREALPASARACSVVPAGLGEEIGDVAALCVAMDGLARSSAAAKEAILSRNA